MNFSLKLKQLRLSSNMKQQELADKLHISQQAVAKWENGKSEPNILMLQNIANLFDCSVDDLIDSEKDLDELSQIAVSEGHSIVMSNFDKMCSELDEKTKDRLHTVMYSLKRINYNTCIDVVSKQFIFSCIAELIGRVEMYADNIQSALSHGVPSKNYIDKHNKNFISSEIEILKDVMDTIYPSDKTDEDEKNIIIPMYLTAASAGTGSWLADDIPIEWTTVPKNSKTESADYILQVNGDSMEPRLHNGDAVLIKESPSIKEGEIGVFVLNNESFIKKMGRGELISLNPNYKPIKLTEFDDIRCAGIVIDCIDMQ